MSIRMTCWIYPFYVNFGVYCPRKDILLSLHLYCINYLSPSKCCVTNHGETQWLKILTKNLMCLRVGDLSWAQLGSISGLAWAHSHYLAISWLSAGPWWPWLKWVRLLGCAPHVSYLPAGHPAHVLMVLAEGRSKPVQSWKLFSSLCLCLVRLCLGVLK